ncbi:hypothetical protein TYRP_003426 [Tyrophagus putrescentiae]|nr:hypothetical protein TYRP_003426 [Tyrophagus putrescentiae]
MQSSPSVFAVSFTDCGSRGKTNIRHILIEGCDSEGGASLLSPGQPCLLSRGRDLWFRAKFVPHDNYVDVKTELRAKIGFFERPITDAIDEDACKRYLKCPLVKNEPQWINTTFTVPTSVPRTSDSILIDVSDCAITAKFNVMSSCLVRERMVYFRTTSLQLVYCRPGQPTFDPS